MQSGKIVNSAGGNFAHAEIELTNGAEFVVAGGSGILQTDGTLRLTLSSATQMSGPDTVPERPPGVYRLNVRDAQGIWAVTDCISFNATAAEVQPVPSTHRVFMSPENNALLCFSCGA